MIKRVIAGSAIAAAGWLGYSRARRWWSTWGVDPAEAARPLPGDDLIADANVSDTRGITVDAPPEAIWPWLVQMGYGRAGWYSYDAMDMRGSSADSILPEHQSLAVGDVVPTDPGGGFIVKAVDLERTLVLYVDQEVVASRARTMGDVPAGLAASGAFLETSMPPSFSVSWAFVLEPLPDGQTRLIERIRGRMMMDGGAPRFLGPILGFGIFVMTQRQMLGLKTRAERLGRDRAALHREVVEIVDRAMTVAPDAAEGAAPPG
jgi:hypothetical protein